VKTILFLLGLLVLGCGRAASPTEPLDPFERSTVAVDAQPQDLAMLPAVAALEPGETIEAVIRGPWTYPLGVDFRSTDTSVLQVSGRIAPGSAEGVVRLTAVAEGRAQVLCLLYSFGRGPGTRVIGTIVVADSTRRRGVRH
jgi:hypothetical protein